VIAIFGACAFVSLAPSAFLSPYDGDFIREGLC
jgi:hypothetical protein